MPRSSSVIGARSSRCCIRTCTGCKRTVRLCEGGPRSSACCKRLAYPGPRRPSSCATARSTAGTSEGAPIPLVDPLTGRSWPVSVASVASPPYFFSGSCPDALDTVSPSCTASHKARPTRNLLGSAVGQADLQAAVHVRAVEQSAGLLYDDAFPAVIHLPRCSRRVFCADPPRVSPAGAFKLPGRSHALANPCRLQTSTVLSTAFPRSGSPPRTRTYEYRRSAR
jgi:hypothetical protein